MAAAKPSPDDSDQDYKVVAVDSSTFKDFLPEDQEKLSNLIDTAWEAAEKLNDINTLLQKAQSQYRAIHQRKAENELYGHDTDATEHVLEEQKALNNFDTRINNRLGDLKELTGEDDEVDALKETLWVYTGVHSITIPRNHYTGFDLDQNKISDLRAYATGGPANDSPLPIQGYIVDYDEAGGQLGIGIDLKNRYSVLNKLSFGATLEELFDDTSMAENQRSEVRARRYSEEFDTPLKYEYWIEINDAERGRWYKEEGPPQGLH